MAEISKPNSRTFWKATGTGVLHEGFTDINQVTTTGQPTFESNVDATTLYPALPTTGTMTRGDIYSYEGGMIIVEQTHERTIYAPEDTPALFSVYRANTEGMNWVANEQVVIGDKRNYNGKTYQCLQSHQTQAAWTPDVTPALWKLVAPVTDEWTYPVSYSVNQLVTYHGSTYKCLQAHTSQAGWTPPVVPALWQLV